MESMFKFIELDSLPTRDPKHLGNILDSNLDKLMLPQPRSSWVRQRPSSQGKVASPAFNTGDRARARARCSCSVLVLGARARCSVLVLVLVLVVVVVIVPV